MSAAAFAITSSTVAQRPRIFEWLGLTAIALADVIWAQSIGLHVIIAVLDFKMVALVLAVAIGLHIFRQRRGAMIAEYLALSLTMALVFTVFCYLAFASSGPLMDRQLLATDRAMGFDWLTGFNFVRAHPLIAAILSQLYDSLNVQALYVCVFLGMLDRENALRELFWVLFVSAVITNAIAIAIPAYGPFEVFGLSSHGAFLPDMKHLKSGHELNFALNKMTGVICFPSFHTVMALAYAWALRRTGIIGYAIGVINFAMLFSIPFFGGHYLIDMIAGAVVMVLSVAIVKHAQTWLADRPLEPAPPLLA